MLKFNGKNESGRSMVEMLGVLAIVGVLSVGGIAGYTTAMNAHRANEAINRVMRLAVMISGQKLLGQPASLSGIDADNVTLTQTEEGKFTLTLSGLSPSVRTRIASMDLATATFGTDAQGNPTFTFSNDLGEAPAAVDPSTITSADECINAGYLWLAGGGSVVAGCYASESEASAICQANGRSLEQFGDGMYKCAK